MPEEYNPLQYQNEESMRTFWVHLVLTLQVSRRNEFLAESSRRNAPDASGPVSEGCAGLRMLLWIYG